MIPGMVISITSTVLMSSQAVSAPLSAGEKVPSFAEGTVYVNACTQASRGRARTGPAYIETYFQGKSSYLRIAIEGKRLNYEARGQQDEVLDSFVIEK